MVKGEREFRFHRGDGCILGEETSVFLLTNRRLHAFPLAGISHMLTERSRADMGTETPQQAGNDGAGGELCAPDSELVPNRVSPESSLGVS